MINGSIRHQIDKNTDGIKEINDRGNPAFKRISGRGSSGGSSSSSMFRAACTADAGSGSTIAATLYRADGTTGDAITVYCNISNGAALNSAVPRLEIGDNIFVTKSTYNNSGTPESRWYCVTNFQTSEDCTCGT